MVHTHTTLEDSKGEQLLDKASYLGELSGSDDDEDGDAPAEGDESTFPSFETYLTERPEIKKILSRRTLD
ncbi:hypothetical protein JCM10450v2_006854 [Rhodotorula kratochvilovae]